MKFINFNILIANSFKFETFNFFKLESFQLGLHLLDLIYLFNFQAT